MDFLVDPGIHMWFGLLVTAVAVVAFVREKIPIEITSAGVLMVLLLFGQVFPLLGEDGRNQLDAVSLLSGFSNPSLIAVLALLVMGQGLIQTDSLRVVTGVFRASGKVTGWISIIALLLFVCVISAFMNNTPLVVIAIPLIQVLARNVKISESRVMMSLSFVAILGGMMTLIGSSTNLLVSSTVTELGYHPIGFFDFIIPGAILAGAGFIYVLLVLPFVLPVRSNMAKDLVGSSTEFVAELDVAEDSKLIGLECVNGVFPKLPDLNIKLIQRGGHLILPPFEGYAIEANDILIVAATRETLVSLLSKYPGFLLSEEEAEVIEQDSTAEGEASSAAHAEESRVLAQIMITPASRLVDMSLEHANFQRQYGVIVLGIQRRAKVVRRRLGRIRLEAGDVLLVAGRHSTIDSMRDSTHFIVLSGSKRDLPVPRKAPLAIGIFIATVVAAAMGIISIPVAAFCGAVAMLITGCLNIVQATRSIDRKIFLLVGSMLALGIILESSGAARHIAELVLSIPFANSPIEILSVLFLLVAIATNLLSNNACAILFTPIAMNLVSHITLPGGSIIDLPELLAITVIFAANCSFASPIGYQTNLLVMGPGQYRFRDFMKAGIPLVLVLWITYILVLRYYYGL